MLGMVETGKFILRFRERRDKDSAMCNLRVVWRGESIEEMMSNAKDEGLKFTEDETCIFGGYFVDDNGDLYLPDVG